MGALNERRTIVSSFPVVRLHVLREFWSLLRPITKVVIPATVIGLGNGQDHEVAYSLPGSHLKDLVEGLAKTHERGCDTPSQLFTLST